MGTHTPGPWKAEGEMVSAHHAAGNPALEYWICEDVNGDSRHGATSGRPSDNARLIAAAPDLLAALIGLRDHGHTQACWDNAMRAIAKATGATP